MPTTVTKSIGSAGRDYSSLQAWEDAAPADLTAVDQIYRGEVYNDSELSGTLVCAGTTVDATRYMLLTAAAGQSFQDNGSVRTNGLRYNQANGAACAGSAAYGQAFNLGSYCRVSRLQFKQTADGTCLYRAFLVTDCIVTITANSTGTLVALEPQSGNKVINTLAYVAHGSGNTCFTCGDGYSSFGAYFISCTAIRTSNQSAAGTGFNAPAVSNNKMQSCASFGFTNAAGGSGWDTTNSKNNACNNASGLPGSSNQHSVTYNATTPFAQADGTGTLDLKSIASTSLADNGFLDSTNAPNDITGTARDSTPTIGVWELSGGGGGGGSAQNYLTLTGAGA